MRLKGFSSFLIGSMLCGVLLTPAMTVAQTPQSSAADTSAPQSAKDQQEALKNEEKANKQRAKSAKEQRKALKAQEKAAKADKKAGAIQPTAPASSTPPQQ